MTRRGPSRLALVAATFLLASCRPSNYTPLPPQAPNGIYVGEPKVYDDASLDAMLRNAQARVAALNGFDTTSIFSHLGAVQGAAAEQTQVAASVSGLPKQGATAQPVTPAAPTQPNLPSFTLPSAYSSSAGDIFNEQTQLNFQMANLQLLLEGSLNDQFVEGTNKQRRRITLGFPISISVRPGSEFEQAVAEVEVSVCTPPESDQSDPSSDPSLVNIIPREKTYNVASMVSKSASIGGGAIAGVVNFGAGLLHGHQTYYLVQDQDTVALAREPRAGVCQGNRMNAAMKSVPSQPVTFAWQFRPVLGQKVVSDGMRQTFAQISLPPALTQVACSASMQVRTSWRHYDAKTGRVGDLLPGTERVSNPSVASYDISPAPSGVITQDNGDGTVTVLADGGYKNGMRVRIGNQILDATTPAQFEQNPTYIKFIAPGATVAVLGAKLVNRDGTEADVVNRALGQRAPVGCPVSAPKTVSDAPAPPAVPSAPPPQTAAAGEKTAGQTVPTPVTPTPLAADTSILTLPLNPDDAPGRVEVAVVLIGAQAFGLRNSPFLSQNEKQVSLVVTNDLLRTNGQARWIKLFSPTPPHVYAIQQPLGFAVSGVTLLASGVALPNAGGTGSLFAIAGSRLQELSVSLPAGAAAGPLNNDTIRTFYMTDDQAKDFKNIVVQNGAGAPLVLALPAPPTAAAVSSAAKPSISAQPAAGIAATTKSLTLTGSGMSQVVAVFNGATPLAFTAASDKSLTLALPPLSPPGLTLVFLYADKSLQPYFIPVAGGGH